MNAKRVSVPVLLLFTCAVLLFLGAVLWATDSWRNRASGKRTQQLTLAMPSSEVLKIMGEPVTVIRRGKMFLSPGNPETWVYGPKYELRDSISKEPPFFWPIRFRFRPYDDDLVIEFNESNRVSRVVNPKTQLPR
jgi:hypothetical protein